MSAKRLYNQINVTFKLVLSSLNTIEIVKINVHMKVMSGAVSCNLTYGKVKRA